MTEFKLHDIRDRVWIFYGVSARPIYYSIYSYYTKDFFVRYNMPNDFLLLQQGEGVQFFYDGDQLNAIAKRILPALIAEQWGFYDRWEKEASEFEALHYSTMEKSLEGLPDEELHSLIRTYRECFEKQFVTNNIIEPLSYYFQHSLKKLLLEHGLSDTQSIELMDEYGKPSKLNYVKLAAKEYKNAQSKEDVVLILKKYHYLNNDYTGPKPLDEEDLRKLSDSDFSIAEPVLAANLSSAYARKLLEVLHIVATVQDVRKAQLLMMVSAIAKFTKERAGRSGIDFARMEYATWKEIEEGTFNEAELEKRRVLMVFYSDKEGSVIYTGDLAKRISDELSESVMHVQNTASEVVGVCASKGKVTGRAVIVLRTDEFHKIKEGDILVTMMTRPEYLPIMGLAAAFVCDEGGITSHAAIVAREMKKPCVIATKIATKVLKDGDLVEVNADNGIVTVLSR